MDENRKERLNLLSIDGGASGLSALYTLDEMFSRMQYDARSSKEQLPCEHFDMIVATGPGALVALLIGKLRMTTSEAIEAYMKLTSVFPVQPAKDDDERRRNAEAFEKVFSEVLVDVGFETKSPMVDKDDPKIIICASNAANVSVLYPIRSYRIRGAPPPPCTILQAARACIASPDKFLPITIGSSSRIATLMDATIGYSNPAKELLREAQDIFGAEAEAASIISIGAGKAEFQRNGDWKGSLAVCEQVHEELQTRLGEANVYYRFNVEKETGVEPEVVLAHVSGYLAETVVSKRLDDVIEGVKSRPKGVSLKYINSVRAVEILKPRPSLVHNFIGRQDILQAIHRVHIISRPPHLRTPAISVLFGLGGSGKTQTALKFALDFENLRPGIPVFFLNASSDDSLKADLEALIRSRGPEYRTKTWNDALVYLTKEYIDWLVILDNADDPSVRLFPYIPKCAHGNVIITTRNSNHITLSSYSNYHLGGLKTPDAIELILTSSGYEDNKANRLTADAIALALGNLPLALSQAAGYILVHRCLSTYLDIYRTSKGKLLAKSPCELPSDYPTSVAATIQMSLDRLSQAAQDVIRLFAHMDSMSIAHEIISKAANRGFRDVSWPLEAEQSPLTIQHSEALNQIFSPNGEWIESDFNDLITQCMQYSLIQLSLQGDTKFYSMHVLVQSYLQSSRDSIRHFQPQSLVIRVLGTSATYGSDYEHIAFNRLLAPHLKIIQTGRIIEPGDHFAFGQVFYDTGDRHSSVVHREQCVKMCKELWGEEQECTLAAMLRLTSSYRVVGRSQEAVEIEEKVVEINRRLHGLEDHDTLAAMMHLSNSYQIVGREEEALKMREESVEISRRVLGPEHADTLVAENNLAVSYSFTNRHEEALTLREGIIEKRKRVLGLEHPHTLQTMGFLATSYYNVGRHAEALELGQMVLEHQMRIIGPDHPDTLITMRCHLVTLLDLEMMDKFRELLQVTVPAYERVHGINHEDTIELKETFKEYLSPVESV